MIQGVIDLVKKQRSGETRMAIKRTLRGIRNGLVAIEIIEQPTEQKTKSGIWLPTGGMGMQFKMATVIAVGPGILLESGVRGGMEDLKVGDTVLVKTGEKKSRGTGDVMGVEMRSCLDLDLGDKKIIMLNQLDILAILDVEEVPEESKPETPATSGGPKLVVD